MILLDYAPLDVGGCQQMVGEDQNILWAFDGFNKMHFLKLEGSGQEVKVGDPYKVTVTDGQTKTAIKGATVGGEITDQNGVATIRFKTAGIEKLKAESRCAVRSNAIKVTVKPAT
jgi:hypothetical protein